MGQRVLVTINHVGTALLDLGSLEFPDARVYVTNDWENDYTKIRIEYKGDIKFQFLSHEIVRAANVESWDMIREVVKTTLEDWDFAPQYVGLGEIEEAVHRWEKYLE
jgi:hypothetical protein